MRSSLKKNPTFDLKSTSTSPGRRQMPENDYINYEQSVADIVAQCHERFSAQLNKQKAKSMIRRSTKGSKEENGPGRFGMYLMPSQQQLRKEMKVVNTARKQRLLAEIAQNSTHMEGIVSINEVKRSKNVVPQNQTDHVQDYVDHFSHMADIIGSEQTGIKKIFANHL